MGRPRRSPPLVVTGRDGVLDGDATFGLTEWITTQEGRIKQGKQITAPGRPNWPERLTFQIVCLKLGKPKLEFRFHPTRKWRFDIAFVDEKLGIEVDGGGFVAGRHSQGKGIEQDCEKFAEAMVLGWRVLRVTPKHVQSGQAVTWIQQIRSRSPVGSVA